MAVTERQEQVQPSAPARARMLRFLFGLLYRNRTLYWLASTIPFAGQWRVWQRLAVPRIVGADVLEIGCGIGKLLADMVQAGYACTAVDRSPQMVAATRGELRRRGLPTDAAPVLLASAQRLPFPAASFDTVVSTFPTDYIFDPATLHEVARVLRPGGRLIIVMGAELLPARAALVPLVALQTLVYGRRGEASGAGRANCALSTTSGLGKALTEAGFLPQAECVAGPFWQAYLLLAERSDMADVV
ncbi:MAG: class I SAM-dependent methyltransferase [Ktedonobacterales bacterium]